MSYITKLVMALEFLKSRVTVMMKERDKAIDRADALQDTVRQATDVINKLESDKRDVEGSFTRLGRLGRLYC